jgi:hypothetical protein
LVRNIELLDNIIGRHGVVFNDAAIGGKNFLALQRMPAGSKRAGISACPWNVLVFVGTVTMCGPFVVHARQRH